MEGGGKDTFITLSIPQILRLLHSFPWQGLPYPCNKLTGFEAVELHSELLAGLDWYQ